MTKQNTQSQSPNHDHKVIHGRSRFFFMSLAVIATIAVIAIAAFQLLIFVAYKDDAGNASTVFANALQKTATPEKTTEKSDAGFVQAETIQAVFLTNGQVYFGRITTLDKDLLILEDVFYPKAQTTDADKTTENASADIVTEAGGVVLRKLGTSEFHQPQDTLYIEPSNMLYWENLDTDSRVTKGIVEYEKKQTNTVKVTPTVNASDTVEKGSLVAPEVDASAQ